MSLRQAARLLPALAVLLPAAAPAQAPPPQPGLIERVVPAEPPRLGPSLAPPEPARATGPGETRRVALGRIRLEGAAALPDAARHPAIAALDGRDATLAEIEAARLAVLRAYRDAGFPYVAIAAALAPMPDGGAELRLRVTEGFVAELVLEGEVGPAAPQARRFLAPLVGLRPLPGAALERALLLASDIPGVTARGVLRPATGDEPGALQLVVRLERQPVSGFASLDNRGYTLTGAWQGLLGAQLNALTGRGERTELALLQTEANGQSFAQVAHELFLGASGLRLRAYAGAGRAAPGSALAAIGYAGETRVAGLALSHPLVRSRPLNVTLSAQLDAFESVVEARDGPGLPRTRRSRDAVRALRLGVDGAAQDALFGLAPAAASTTALLRLHRGLEAFGASDGDSGTTARLGSEFGFTRIVAEATRLQPLAALGGGWLLSVQGQAAAQWSDAALPPAEKFYLGGTRLGRGFYAGQVAGDRALAGSAEIQAGRVGVIAMPQGWPGGAELRLGTQFYLFRDEGRAWDNASPGVGGGVERSLASWGGGVRLQFDDRVQLDLEAVRRLTRSPDGAGVRPVDEAAVFARLLLRY
jgi:hemolysin activation/secretion protein